MRLTIVLTILLVNTSCFSDKKDCVGRQGVARASLGALVTAEDTYKMQHGAYSANIAEVDPNLPSSDAYDFVIDSASATSFSARAIGKGKMAGDLWTASNVSGPRVVNDKCAK